MFVLATIVDTVRIPPSMFALPTLVGVHQETDKKYPNRVIMDLGLVICRFGDAVQVGDGVCVAGDGGAHHEVILKLVVFRPFVEEVCVGTIIKSTEEGLQVSIGFFDDIFIPAYWMLRPSRYEAASGLWVWTPNYDEKNEVEDADDAREHPPVKSNPDVLTDGNKQNNHNAPQESEANRYEMEIGSQIRFKIKSINFTQVTNTAKGVQARTTTTSHSISGPSMERALSVGSASEMMEQPVRKRSSSIDISESSTFPASMHITASICEDGLGLTSWWTAPDDDDEEEEGEEEADEDR